MDRIDKALIFDSKVLVSVIKINNIMNKLKEMHSLSNVAIAALGRTMTVGAYMCSNLKNDTDKLSITINGGGPLGNIIVAGRSNARIRGYVSNPNCEPPLNEQGKLNVGLAVGAKGNITVIRDIGLKEPYVGVSPLVSGEIGEDFANYYYNSEQQPIAIAVGAMIEGDKVYCGGIVIQPMPDCPDYIITVLLDIIGKFNNISEVLRDKEPQDIINQEFSHFEHVMLTPIYPVLECICSKERMDNIIKSLNPLEVFDILKSDDKMELMCHFCNTKYNYSKEEVIKLRNKDNIE